MAVVVAGARPSGRFARVVGVLAAFAALLAVQCTNIERATRVSFTLDAPVELRERIAQIDLALYADISSGAWRLRTREVLKPEDPNTWPLHWGITRGNSHDLRYSLEAQAKDKSGSVLAELRAVGEFRDEETVRLSLHFDASCAQPCSEAQTCSQGQCIAADEVVKTAVQSASEDGVDSPATGSDLSAACGGGAGATCSDACASMRGSCDPLAACSLEGGVPRCGVCPEGFLGTGATGCRAGLSALTVEGATLDPPFSSDRTEYTLNTGLLRSQWKLTPMASPQAVVRVAGKELASLDSVGSAQLSAGQEVLTIDVTAPKHEGTPYRFELQSRGAQRDVLKATSPTQDGRFGHRVVVDGDTLVTSAVGDATDAQGVNPPTRGKQGLKNSGAVHVFRRKGAGWEQEAFIKASDASEGAAFGSSLALQGDTLVVGAWTEGDRGAAYVFLREGGAWREQGKLVAEARESGANFGQSVALQGDMLVIGAGGAGSNDVGAAVVYRRPGFGGAWGAMQAVSPAEQLRGYSWFGSSVRLSSDYLVVGATGEGDGTVASGVAYVFRADTLEPIDVLRPSAAAAAGFFGERIAIAGDTIAVSSLNNNAGLTNGVVYIFERSASGKFEQRTELQASNADGGDMFGSALVLTQDYLLVGAVNESSGARGIDGSLSASSVSNSGAAYLFSRTGRGFTQIAHIKVDEPQRDEQFANDLALSGADILVAAARDARVATGSGAIYIFR